MIRKQLAGRLEGGEIEADVVLEREFGELTYRIVRLRRHKMNNDTFVLECLAGEDACNVPQWLPAAMSETSFQWLIDSFGKSHVKPPKAD